MKGFEPILARTSNYTPVGSFQMCIPTGLATTIAAGDFTNAGQLFNFRWDSATLNAYVRYIGARFVTTTAFGAAQVVGCGLALASAFTVNGSNGTAVDCGTTKAATGKLRNVFAKSAILAGSVRVADASAITAGTHTLHANYFSTYLGWSGAAGATIPAAGESPTGYAALFDGMNPSSPNYDSALVFTEDSGFVINNLVLMGAAGVGYWHFKVIWDEGTDA